MSKRVREFDHFFGMERARSLQRFARELKETTDINKQDLLLYEGKIATTPTLFALATELALKALHCQETKSNKVKATHDLRRSGRSPRQRYDMFCTRTEEPSSLGGILLGFLLRVTLGNSMKSFLR